MLCLYECKVTKIKDILRYAKARVKQETQQIAYRSYIADTLKIIAENTAKAIQEGKYPTQRFTEIIHPVKERSVEEIIESVIKNAELVVI